MRPGPIAVLFLQKVGLAYLLSIMQAWVRDMHAKHTASMLLSCVHDYDEAALIEADMASSQGVEHDTKGCAVVVVLM
jgi:hypothetical protein